MERMRQSLTHCISGLLFRVRISGESCWPVLVPGRSYWASALMPVRTGDFVVFRNPADCGKILVKKVYGVRAEGYSVGSLVSWGSSSKDFGIVNKRNVLGRVVQRHYGA